MYKMLKIIVLSFFYLTFNVNLNAQINIKDTTVYTIVERNPEYPEGQAALFRWISKNLKTSQLKLTDDCYITRIDFIIEKNGQVSYVEPRLPCGIKTYDKALKVALKKAFEDMPRWKPGMQNGKAVRVRYTLAIHIRNE